MKRRSTPHKKGAIRANASGLSTQVTFDVPSQWKPLRSGIYKIRLEIKKTKTKRITHIIIRDLFNYLS